MHGAQYKFWECLKTLCGSPHYTNCRNVIITVPAWWFTATGSRRRRPCHAPKRPCTNSRLSCRPVLSVQRSGGYYTCHVTRHQTVYYAFVAIYSGSIDEFLTHWRIGYNRSDPYVQRVLSGLSFSQILIPGANIDMAPHAINPLLCRNYLFS